MLELDNKSICENFVPKEGQRGLLSSNNKSHRCPSLCYMHIENDTSLRKAFDVLFKAVRRLKSETNYDDTKIDCDLRKSINIAPGE